MAKGKLILILIAAAMLGLVAILALPKSDRGSESGDALILHCAAGLRLPVTEIVEAYRKETGRSVQLNFGPSGALEAALEVAGGDLFRRIGVISIPRRARVWSMR
jgi:molybdate transport system substrate-binding protein